MSSPVVDLVEAAQDKNRRDTATLAAVRSVVAEFERLAGQGAVPEALERLRSVAATIPPAEARRILEDPGRTLADAVVETMAAAERHQAGGLAGIPTGHAALDDVLGGWPRGLCLIGGWGGCGKSALLTDTLISAREAGHRWCLYSVDMEPMYWLGRLHRFRFEDDRRIERMPMAELRGVLDGARRWIIDGGCAILRRSRSIEAIVADAAGRRGQFDLVVVDTLQSCETDPRQRSLYEAITDAALRLKALSATLGVPVLVTAQIKDPPSRHETAKASRESRPEAIAPPTSNEFEGSRRLTHEAAAAVLVYREDYQREDPRAVLVPGLITVAKSQNGRGARLACDWDSKVARWRTGGSHAR